MKGLIVDKPEDPVNYLCEKLQAQDSKLFVAVSDIQI